MSASPLSVERWLGIIDTEYLATFVPQGGAAVRFVVCPQDGAAQTVMTGLDRLGQRRGLRLVSVDGAQVRLHMIQNVWFRVAETIDWGDLASQLFLRFLADQRCRLPENTPRPSLVEIGQLNEIDPALLYRDLNVWLTRHIMQHPHMVRDFRTAIAHLVRTMAHSHHDLVDAPIIDWLTGQLTRIAALRDLQIFQKITRHTARGMLTSLSQLLHLLGCPGLLLVLDVRSLIARQPTEAGLRYSTAAVMDAYEMIRQLIDGTEQMAGCLVVLLADDETVNGDPRRSIETYPALKARIWDDVRDRVRPNPLAPLIWLHEVAP